MTTANISMDNIIVISVADPDFFKKLKDWNLKITYNKLSDKEIQKYLVKAGVKEISFDFILGDIGFLFHPDTVKTTQEPLTSPICVEYDYDCECKPEQKENETELKPNKKWYQQFDRKRRF